jgi:hypothetical protein
MTAAKSLDLTQSGRSDFLADRGSESTICALRRCLLDCLHREEQIGTLRTRQIERDTEIDFNAKTGHKRLVFLVDSQDKFGVFRARSLQPSLVQ